MVGLKAFFEATNGPMWTLRDYDVKWDFTKKGKTFVQNPCAQNWAGVSCEQPLNQITELSLPERQLNGKLPAELQYLTSLKRLDLNTNKLYGSLPTLSKLVYLKELDLSVNLLTGTLPQETLCLPLLQIISLRENNMNGTIPPLSKMPNLVQLVLSNNSFSGKLSVGGDTTVSLSLTKLLLHFNKFSGSIPQSLFTLAKKLNSLDLSYNLLTGEFPKGCVALEILKLDGNALSGVLPSSFANCVSIKLIWANRINLTSSLPTEIGRLTNLVDFQLQYNRFTGKLPTEFGRLSQVGQLYLNDNLFTGKIPTQFGALKNLQVLFLSRNSFTGIIPSELFSLPKVSVISLDSNSMTGSIPSDMTMAKMLVHLKLSHNTFSKSIPSAFPGNLIFLELMSNKFTGKIPDLSKISTLSNLWLNGNSLSGSIPEYLPSMKNMQRLCLASNNLHGPLDVLCELKKLEVLQLSSNQFSGTIPRCIGNLTALSTLDLENNTLQGPLPVETGRLERLEFFNAGQNSLIGPISPIYNLKMLKYLILGSNKFSSKISTQIGNLGELLFLELSHNLFSSSLPSQIGQLTKLCDLKLSFNLISGPIPTEMGKLLNLKLFKAENNKISSSLPTQLCNLRGLSELDLTTNHLTGPITDIFSTLSEMKSLKLSSNMFSGTVPWSIGQLKMLEILHLDHNNLTTGHREFVNPEIQTLLFSVDISSNRFEGNFPSVLFSLKGLQILAATNNIFSGDLPDNMCGAKNLKILILDGLSSGLRRPFWPGNIFGFTGTLTSKKKMSGSIPSCILTSLSKLEVLHLSANGFTGALPTTDWSSSLQNIVLSYNRIESIISVQTQKQFGNLTDIDLSTNWLTGTCDSIEMPKRDLAIDTNRLSGKIPSGLLSGLKSTQTLSILRGNLFDCAPFSTLQIADPYISKYECGSNKLNYMLFTFFVFLLITGVLWRRGVFRGIVMTDEEMLLEEESKKCVPPDLVVLMSQVFCLLKLFIVLFIAVLLPVYGVMSSTVSDYTNSYAWSVSVAFKSSANSSIALVFFFSILFCCTLRLILYFDSKLKLKEIEPTITKIVAEPEDGHAATAQGNNFYVAKGFLVEGFMILFATFINGAISISGNIGFVYLSSISASETQIFIYSLLMIYKKAWNDMFLPRFLKILLSKKKTRIVDALRVVFVLFNNVLAPCVATAVTDKSCFREALLESEPISSFYEEESCEKNYVFKFAFNQFDRKMQFITKEINSCVSTRRFSTFSPPFIYNYSCTPRLLQVYAPAFMLIAILTGFGWPVLYFILRRLADWLRTSEWRNSVWARLFFRVLPNSLKTVVERRTETALATNCDDVCISSSGSSSSSGGGSSSSSSTGSSKFCKASSSCCESSLRVVNLHSFFIMAVKDIALIMSFGVACPLLGLAQSCALLSKLVMLRASIARFLRDEQKNEKEVEDFRQLAEDALKSNVNPFYAMRWLLILFSAVFLSLFMLDMTGGKMSIKLAIVPPILMFFVLGLVLRFDRPVRWAVSDSSIEKIFRITFGSGSGSGSGSVSVSGSGSEKSRVTLGSSNSIKGTTGSQMEIEMCSTSVSDERSIPRGFGCVNSISTLSSPSRKGFLPTTTTSANPGTDSDAKNYNDNNDDDNNIISNNNNDNDNNDNYFLQDNPMILEVAISPLVFPPPPPRL